MSKPARVGLLLGASAAMAILAEVLDRGAFPADLIVLAAGIALGELVVLHPVDRSPLPMSFAVFTVLVRAAPLSEILVVVVAAELVAAILRMGPMSLSERLRLCAERCVEGLAAGVAYQVVLIQGRDHEAIGAVLLALMAAAIAPILIADVITFVRNRTVATTLARGADVAVVTSGVLMAIGYEGINGAGRLGLWGPVLFAIPLIAAWYSFELLAYTRRSLEQTIEALAAAPELGGLVREGHAHRVAELSASMARLLDLHAGTVEQLRTAALLHHLGAVCLDEPADGLALDPVEVATAGASMLRASEVLAPAGDVVAAEPLLHRPPGVGEPVPAALSGMILKVASAYDELTEGNDEHAAWAVEALYTGPGYVYDGRVLGALERVLERRGVLEAR